MPDYNVYIHAIGTGGNSSQNPTTPWSARDGGGFSQTTSQSSDNSGSDVAKSIINASSIMQNPDSVVSAATSTVSKAFPIVAVAYAVVKLAVKTVDTALDFYVLESGNYRPQYIWNDFKRIFAIGMNPASSFVQAYKTERQWALEEQKAKLQRDLLGGTFVDTRGV